MGQITRSVGHDGSDVGQGAHHVGQTADVICVRVRNDQYIRGSVTQSVQCRECLLTPIPWVQAAIDQDPRSVESDIRTVRAYVLGAAKNDEFSSHR
jgi:hypothetical protein